MAASLESNQLVRTGICSTAAIGAAEDPERCLHTVLRVGLDGVLPSWWAALLLTMVRCALTVDRHDDARRWAVLARERAAALRLPASSARAAIATAEALLADDQPQRAADAALEAVATGEHAGALRDAAEARLLAGRALAAAGDTERAITVLQKLAADSARGGALALTRAAGRELRRLGARPATKARRAAEWRPGTGLSPREREIAQLVAAGHSNKQIAATLHLSEKTVRNTLTRVYAKLEIRSRTQLARLHAN
jgi:DNA-binding CsgD family transcriptional regulator